MTAVQHRVARLSFRAGVVECLCGATLTNREDVVNGDQRYPAGTPEALRAVFSGHRAAVGLSSRNVTAAYDPTGLSHGPDMVVRATHQRGGG